MNDQGRNQRGLQEYAREVGCGGRMPGKMANSVRKVLVLPLKEKSIGST